MLLQLRRSRRAAMEGAADWMTEIMNAKARGALVARFANESTAEDRMAAVDDADVDDGGAQSSMPKCYILS